MGDWNPDRYLQFADERSRPFADLVVRIAATDPATVVDLGCGPGQLTATLPQRWPRAQVVGVDSSPAMIESAAAHASAALRFEQADLRTWSPAAPVDVMVSNAALQWVPEHRALLPGLVDRLAVGGWLAFQVPGNFGAPSHRLLHALADRAPYAAYTREVARPASVEPEDYLADLVATGCRVDVWETTYLHVLTGPDPVLRWISSTGARPVLQALPDDLRSSFTAAYGEQLAEAYPATAYGTVLPFRRIFAVAQRL